MNVGDVVRVKCSNRYGVIVRTFRKAVVQFVKDECTSYIQIVPYGKLERLDMPLEDVPGFLETERTKWYS